MKKNIGKADRYFRIILAVVIFAAGIIFQSWWGLLGFLPLITALVKTCPLYSAIGVTTDSKVINTKKL